MNRLPEMIAILIKAGMDSANPPIGFSGGPDLPVLKGIGPMLNTKNLHFSESLFPKCFHFLNFQKLIRREITPTVVFTV